MLEHQLGDVGEGGQGDKGHLLLAGAEHVHHELDGGLLLQGAHLLAQIGDGQPVPFGVADPALADQGVLRAPGHRDVGLQVAHQLQGVLGGVLDGLVAHTGGDAQHLQLGAGDGQGDRAGVVSAGIAVK